MAFIRLLVTGLLEIGWAYTLKRSENFSHVGWGIATIVILLLSLYILETVVDVFGVGMTYAIFTGIGTAGTSLLGMLVFHESSSLPKLLSLAVLLVGIVGLKVTTKAGEPE